MKAKKTMIIIATIVALFICPSDSKANGTTLFCNSTANVAKNIMKVRQSGKPITSVMAFNEESQRKQISEDPEGADRIKRVHKIIEMIIIDAYKQPQYNSRRIRKRVITEFSTKWYIWARENTSFITSKSR
jgi:hypothetical protein